MMNSRDEAPSTSGPRMTAGELAMLAVALAAVLATRAHGFLLFHSIAEIFSIVIASGIFILTWNARRTAASGFLLLLGTGYASVAALDLLHTLSYRGMGVFPEATANLPTQFWLAARYVEATMFLVAPAFLKRKLRARHALIATGGVTAILAALIFGGLFPDAFVAPGGLTPFKVVSEYAIAAAFAFAIALLMRSRDSLDPRVRSLVAWSLVLRVMSEIAFTLYIDVFGTSNMVGHLLKIAATYLLYKVFIETFLLEPFALLFRDLKRSEMRLRDAVTELEAFSYSVSHDLRTPLTIVSGYSELLRVEHGSSLPPEARGYVDRISAAAKRMGELVNDLLNLSKIGGSDLEVQQVDVSSLAREVVATLRTEKATITIDPSLYATGDPRLLRIVLENLIGNAVKFSSRVPAPQIAIRRAKTAEGAPAIAVSDNGAGFDPSNAHRLFAPFQRLHEQSEFAGSGIGLATVQRIVRRHGGTIWAEGRPGEGATFYFTLE